MLRVEPGDEAGIRACHAVHVAASAVDDPDVPPMSYPMFAPLTREEGRGGGRGIGDPRETWIAADGAGYLSLELPERENTHLAMLELAVHPDRRRRGIGTALLSFAAKRCVELGRSTISTGAWIGSPGEKFLRRYVEFKPGITEVRRVLRVGAIPSVPLAAGYTMRSWTGATAEEWLDRVAGLMEMINDAPRDESWDAELWDAERVRRFERRVAAQGMRYYSIAAVAGAEVAALTQVAVDPERPDWGWQELTAVARAHRGHGLGLALKAAMLEWLASAEPGLRRILTWNAENNKYMVAVNEALGYEIFGSPVKSYRLSVVKP
jgi:GNAT superfamily N-acetyltransferase